MPITLPRRVLIAALAATALAGSAAAGVAGTSRSNHHQKQPPAQVVAFETGSPYCGYAYSPATCDDAGTGTTGAWTVVASSRRYQR